MNYLLINFILFIYLLFVLHIHLLRDSDLHWIARGVWCKTWDKDRMRKVHYFSLYKPTYFIYNVIFTLGGYKNIMEALFYILFKSYWVPEFYKLFPSLVWYQGPKFDPRLWHSLVSLDLEIMGHTYTFL